MPALGVQGCDIACVIASHCQDARVDVARWEPGAVWCAASGDGTWTGWNEGSAAPGVGSSKYHGGAQPEVCTVYNLQEVIVSRNTIRNTIRRTSPLFTISKSFPFMNTWKEDT